MNLDNLSSVMCRGCFFAGFAFLALVLAEELALSFGSSFLSKAYTTETLLNIGTVLFIVVIALLVRQIREELTRRNFIESIESVRQVHEG